MYDKGKFTFSDALPEHVTKLEKKYLSDGENIIDKHVIIYVGDHAPPVSDFSADIDAQGYEGTLFVRSRDEGDKFICKNITRSIKKSFIDKKIPRCERDAVPLICDSNGIIYVPYIGLADRVKPDRGSKTKKISIYIRKANSNQ
ncbi:MAG TPA: tRNA lysidine(34) synthetase TilS [Bacillota bacterium]|nr:tRNA lysidine(34) synthetase TilS [Bacillota bacterium]